MKNPPKAQIAGHRSKRSQESKGVPAAETQQQADISPPPSDTNSQDKQTVQDTVEFAFWLPLPPNTAFMQSLNSLVVNAEARDKMQKDIAKCAGIPLSMLRGWLSGGRKPNRTSFKRLRQLALCLDADPEFLVEKVRKDRGWDKREPSKHGS